MLHIHSSSGVQSKEEKTPGTVFPSVFPVFGKDAIGYRKEGRDEKTLDSFYPQPSKQYIYNRHQTLREYLQQVSSDHMIVVGDDEEKVEDTQPATTAFRALNFNVMHSNGAGWNGIFSDFSSEYSAEPDASESQKKPTRPKDLLNEQLKAVTKVLSETANVGVVTFQELDKENGRGYFSWSLGWHWEEITRDTLSQIELKLVVEKPEEGDIENKYLYIFPLPHPPQNYWSKLKSYLGLQPPQPTKLQYGFTYRFEGAVFTGQYEDETMKQVQLAEKLRQGDLFFHSSTLKEAALKKKPPQNDHRPIFYNKGLYKKAAPCRVTASISIHLPPSDFSDCFDIVLLKPEDSKHSDHDLTDAIAVVNVHFPHFESPIAHENMVKSIVETIGKVYPDVKRVEFSGDFNVRRANVKPGFQPNVTNLALDRVGSHAQQEDRTDIMLSAVKNTEGLWSIHHKPTTTYSPVTGLPLTKDSIISPDLTPDQPHYFQTAFLSEDLPVYGLVPKKLEEVARKFNVKLNIRRSESQHVDTEFRLVFFKLPYEIKQFFRGAGSLVPETNGRGREIKPGDQNTSGYFHLDPSDPLQRTQLLKLFFKVIGNNIHPYSRGKELYPALWTLVILECVEAGWIKKDTKLSEVLSLFDEKPLCFINSMLKKKPADESLGYYAELIIIYLEEYAKNKNMNFFDLLGEIVTNCEPAVIDKIRQAAFVRHPQAAEKNAVNRALKNKDAKAPVKEEPDLSLLFKQALHASYYIYQESQRISQIEHEAKRNEDNIDNNNELKRQQMEWRNQLSLRGELKTADEKYLSLLDKFILEESKERSLELEKINKTIIAQFNRILLYFNEKQKPVERALLLFSEITSVTCKIPQDFIEQAARFAGLVSCLEQDKKEIPGIGMGNNAAYLGEKSNYIEDCTPLDFLTVQSLMANTSSLCKSYVQKSGFMKFYQEGHFKTDFLKATGPDFNEAEVELKGPPPSQPKGLLSQLMSKLSGEAKTDIKIEQKIENPSKKPPEILLDVHDRLYQPMPFALKEAAYLLGFDLDVEFNAPASLIFYNLPKGLQQFFQNSRPLVTETNSLGQVVPSTEKNEHGYFNLNLLDPLQRDLLLKLFFTVMGKKIHPFSRGKKLYAALWPLVVLECREVSEDKEPIFSQSFDNKAIGYLNTFLKTQTGGPATQHYAELIIIFLEEYAKESQFNIFNLLGNVVTECRPAVIDAIYKAACVRFPQALQKKAIYNGIKNKEQEVTEDKKIDLTPLLRQVLQGSLNNPDLDKLRRLQPQWGLQFIRMGGLTSCFEGDEYDDKKIDTAISNYMNLEFKQYAEELTSINKEIVEILKKLLTHLNQEKGSVKRALILLNEIESAKPLKPQDFIKQAVRLASLVSCLEQEKLEIPDLGMQNNIDYLLAKNNYKVGDNAAESASSSLALRVSSLCKLYHEKSHFMKFYSEDRLKSYFLTAIKPILNRQIVFKSDFGTLKHDKNKYSEILPPDIYLSYFKRAIALLSETQTVEDVHAIYTWVKEINNSHPREQYYLYYLSQYCNQHLLRLGYSELHFIQKTPPRLSLFDRFTLPSVNTIGLFTARDKKARLLADEKTLLKNLKSENIELFVEKCIELENHATKKRVSKNLADDWHAIINLLGRLKDDTGKYTISKDSDDVFKAFQALVIRLYEKTNPCTERGSLEPHWTIDNINYQISTSRARTTASEFKQLYALYKIYIAASPLHSKEYLVEARRRLY